MLKELWYILSMRQRRYIRSAIWLVMSITLVRTWAGPNIPASITPPGELSATNVPQMVLLSFDDSVTTASLALVESVLTNHVNPNGDAIQATFFVSLDRQPHYPSIQKLYASGHEIAVHTMTHTTSTSTPINLWRKEIAGCRKTLVDHAAIPNEEIRGFRAPYLQPNDASFQILEEQGFMYDSSLPLYLSGLSTAPTSLIWAYTLDAGLAQSAPAERSPARPYPGLFEVPLWSQFSVSNSVVTTMDPPESYTNTDVLAMWKTNFLWHYNGNRAPFTLALHATITNQWLSHYQHQAWRVETLNEFIDWSLSYSGVYYVTAHDLLDYMQDPVPLSAVATSAPFVTVTHPIHTNVTTCYFNEGRLYTCGECPPSFPAPDTVYHQHVAITGGVVHVDILSESNGYSYCAFTVTNTSGRMVMDWIVDFSLSVPATVSWMWDGTEVQEGTNLTVRARHYNDQLSPGQTATVAFRVDTTNNLSFAGESVQLQGLGPVATELQAPRMTSGGACVLAWDQTAFLYEIQHASNLVHDSWNTVTSDYPYASFTGVVEGTAADCWRVKGLED